MKSDVSRRIFLSGAATPFLVGCGRPQSDPFRYRLAVRVLCDGEQITGEAVSETVWISKRGGYGSVWDSDNRGEATPIELCGGMGYMFALRHRLRPDDDPYETFSPNGTPLAALNGFSSMRELMAKTGSLDAQWNMMTQRARKREEAVLQPANYPMFVRFRDVTDKASVELITEENIDALYNGRVSISEVSIAIANEPLTRRIEGVLPWLAGLGPETTLSGKPLRDPNGFLTDRLYRPFFTE